MENYYENDYFERSNSLAPNNFQEPYNSRNGTSRRPTSLNFHASAPPQNSPKSPMSPKSFNQNTRKMSVEANKARKFSLSPGQSKKFAKGEQNLKESGIAFDQVNSQLLSEMPVFYEDRAALYASLFKGLFASEFRFLQDYSTVCNGMLEQGEVLLKRFTNGLLYLILPYKLSNNFDAKK